MSDDGSEDPPAVETRFEFPPESRRRARRMAWLYTAAGIILLPWIVYLANTLPRRQFDRHYRAAWVGFDIFLVVAIIRTAYMAFRVDPRVQFPATATATLLAVDAWFDITTSGNRTAFFQAVVLAAFIEIPAAVFSIYLAHSVNRRVLELAHLQPPLRGTQRNRGSPPPAATPGEAG
ncbi:MAG TPA: hypothetical protein VMQ59_08120 [Acidimicrobiales bacterium]|nr:hypothetical protein [Acidimicrobiales bacterium]